eukprot:5028026-Pleurochrysis_carterae.AAC.3
MERGAEETAFIFRHCCVRVFDLESCLGRELAADFHAADSAHLSHDGRGKLHPSLCKRVCHRPALPVLTLRATHGNACNNVCVIRSRRRRAMYACLVCECVAPMADPLPGVAGGSSTWPTCPSR